MAADCATRYRARNPRATPLYRLVEAHFDEVKGLWEERFERRCGFWRSFADEEVLRYLDCGLYENGFGRIRCPECAEEYLLAFSCKTRELCPSCAAKRSAATAVLLFRHNVMRLLQDEGRGLNCRDVGWVRGPGGVIRLVWWKRKFLSVLPRGRHPF